MFSESPELYDAIYQSFLDYRQQSSDLADLLAEVAPDAKTVLDIGCGTGEHARWLRADHGYDVDGLDIDGALLGIARAKVPEARFVEADMADFDLGREYDAVLCLFSSIGYLRTVERTESALGRFRRHLTPGGVVVVEPWIAPEALQPGRVFMHQSERDGLSVTRMSHTSVEGRVSVLDFHYLIGTEDGIEHRTERHELGLLTREEMTGAFEAAGYGRVDYDPEGLSGRGMYVARVES